MNAGPVANVSIQSHKLRVRSYVQREQMCVCVGVCVSCTVEALLVDYGAAGQRFVVLLVAHQGVHAQDS